MGIRILPCISGVYYFAGGAVMEKYCQILTEHEECAINGEYYASLPRVDGLLCEQLSVPPQHIIYRPLLHP